MSALAFLILTLPVAALQSATPATTAEDDAFAIRTAVVSVVDAQGMPVQGLSEEDFEIEETGLPRDVVEVRQEDGREIFMLLDTGIGFREEIASLRKGVEAFAAELAEPHEVLLAGFGGDVRHLAGPTSDPDVLARAGARVEGGTGAMHLLDAMAHVCSGVAAARQEGHQPPAVVIVTALSPDASATPIEEVYRFARGSEASFYVFLHGSQTFQYEERLQMENFLATLAQVSGGQFTKLLAGAALPTHLSQLAAELMQPGYRVSFLTEVEPRTKLEDLSIRARGDGLRVSPIRLLPHEQVVTSGGFVEEATR